jgi:N-acylneuraminate cytidylyltransferase/CMP-N,N'-diacetyllegionaminic acid synthase
MRYLGLITARENSRRLPGKNLKPLCGKPLIAYTIDAALASLRLDRVVVSTDGAEIASVARQFGAEVPFLRPKELATDDAGSVAVMIHALSWLERHENAFPDALVLLQPTSPLRTGRHIDEAVALYEAREADCVVAVSEAPCRPSWMNTMDADGELRPLFQDERKQTSSQVWSSNGSIWVLRRSSFLARGQIYGGRTFGYVMPQSEAVDVDTPWDFRLAELIIAGR